MGYTLKIGEKIKDGNRVYVDTIELDNAPKDDVPTAGTNARWPSYTGWAEFIKATDLNDLFEKLLKRHPGWVILSTAHQSEINRAYKSIKLLPVEHQVRLEWLKFWTDWAITNCKQPIFYNS